MGSVEEKLKPGGLASGTNNLLEGMKLLKEMQDHTGWLTFSVFLMMIHECYACVNYVLNKC